MQSNFPTHTCIGKVNTKIEITNAIILRPHYLKENVRNFQKFK